MEILMGRIYDATPDGTRRVLVDRLWPRGVRKDGAPWDVWLKEAAPSSDLRVWYHAHPEAREEFRRLYLEELRSLKGQAALAELAACAGDGRIALLTARRELEPSHVPLLREALLAWQHS